MREVKNIEDQKFLNILEKKLKNQPKEGTIAIGKIVDIIDNRVIVDVGLKTEGIICLSEFSSRNKKIIKGEEIEVFVEKIEDRYGNTQISFNRVTKEKSWKKFEEAAHTQENVKGKIIGKLIKGGYAVEIEGILAFLPGSHLDIKQIPDPTEIFHSEQKFKILKIDRNQGNIVVSRKIILEESRKEAKEKMLSNIEEGIKLQGIVKNITNYGAFIDLGEIDGLLHMSDISWNRISHPTEILTLGQKVKVIVIKYNSESQRVSLGMKQLTQNPWDGMDNKFKVGDRYKGIITEINNFGIFIRMKDNKNIIGLVYPNEISWNIKNTKNKSFLTLGQEINVKVIEIDINKHRLNLSIKKCLNNPWEELLKKYPKNSRAKTKIVRILDFGLLVNLIDNNELINKLNLLIPAAEIDWDYKPKESLSQFKKNDIIDCMILDSEIERERITLSIKRLEENDIKKITDKIIAQGAITCKITDVSDKGLKVEIKNRIKGIIKKNELSKDRSQQNPERFAVGDRIDAKATIFNKKEKILKLSVKQLEIDEEKKAINEYGSVNSGATLADILGEAMQNNNK